MASMNEFGPTCRYKGGESHVCNTVEELAEYEGNGWKDTPQDVIDLDADDYKVIGRAPARKKTRK
jgi:hypothetical protein